MIAGAGAFIAYLVRQDDLPAGSGDRDSSIRRKPAPSMPLRAPPVPLIRPSVPIRAARHPRRRPTAAP